MTKLILATGTAGAGKTTILTRLSELNGNKIKVINMGTEMLQIAKEKYNINDRDQLRRMDDKTVISVRNAIMQKVIESKEDAIIDTHASVKQGRRYRPGFSIDELEKIRISAIIYIDTTSEEVLERSVSDITRKRAYETIAEIDEWRSVNISIISTFAVYLNIPIYIIYNQEGKQNEAAEELDRITKEILGG
jgi:adenylate kinase